MAGQKFEYDEKGSTFVYFILSFVGLCLVPATYYGWPAAEKAEEPLTRACRCEPCQQKRAQLKNKDPWKKTKRRLRKLLLLGGWLFLSFLVYQASQFDYEYANFDPYDILQVSPSATNREIKKAYHKLSLKYHPDKETGDEKLFMKLTKAYEALTDETARKNWEMYGNPDGPGAMTFGIALPSWIVEKENSIWILGLYALVFMVALPTVVGFWWYRSIRYSGDAVLLDTTQLYYYFFHKTPSMMLKRALMILAASMEFEPSHASDMKPRPSDNEQVPLLMKQFVDLGEKTQERPLCYTYSLKARALLWAHLHRYQLPPNTLEKDRLYIVQKSPVLIQEMVTCVSQLMMLAHAKRISRMPTLATMENVMKMSPMVVQALWENKNPLLQLPHINEDLLRHFVTKRRNIRSIRQFALLPYDEKRSILRSLNDEEFNNVLTVCKNMPNITMDVNPEVLDDEDSRRITAKAIVTVTVSLKREPMEAIMQGAPLTPGPTKKPGEKGLDDDEDEDGETEEQKDKVKKQQPVWHKNKKKGKGKKGAKKTGAAKEFRNHVVRRTVGACGDPKKEESGTPESTPGGEEAREKRKKEKAERAPKAKDSGSENSASEEESSVESGDEDELENALEREKAEKQSSDEDDETEWEKCQNRLAKKEKMKLLEGRARISHPVHCPFFPDEKHEYWWVYICDKKNKRMLSTPLHVTDLVTEEEVQLKFTAPPKPGVYTFTVNLRSDSYIDFDQFKNIKLNVEEAAQVPVDHPQWDISDEEDEQGDEESDGGISEFTEDDDDGDLGPEEEDLSDDD